MRRGRVARRVEGVVDSLEARIRVAWV